MSFSLRGPANEKDENLLRNPLERTLLVGSATRFMAIIFLGQNSDLVWVMGVGVVVCFEVMIGLASEIAEVNPAVF